jgi:glycosyltransferase involved in cell wall biosynthesis
VASPRDLTALANDPRPIRIVDRHRDHYVPPLELRWVLANTDFHLSFPGMVMPWTHSVVEAMSMGAIPILQFPQLFDPPLRHGIDCIAFTGPADLADAIREALASSRERIQEMSAHVRTYYRSHLSPEVVVERLLADVPGRTDIKLMAEHTSVELLLSSRRSSIR